VVEKVRTSRKSCRRAKATGRIEHVAIGRTDGTWTGDAWRRRRWRVVRRRGAAGGGRMVWCCRPVTRTTAVQESGMLPSAASSLAWVEAGDAGHGGRPWVTVVARCLSATGVAGARAQPGRGGGRVARERWWRLERLEREVDMWLCAWEMIRWKEEDKENDLFPPGDGTSPCLLLKSATHVLMDPTKNCQIEGANGGIMLCERKER
jgi:hypothetical protein